MTTAIILTGTVGSGKTTIADAIAERLAERDESGAMVDMDALRDLRPSDDSDPFHLKLGLANLTAIWPNFRVCGATWLLVADVVREPDQRASYEKALPGARVVIVRLDTPLELVRERLKDRESGESLEWHLEQAGTLQRTMEEHDIGDVVINVADQSPTDAAKLILDQVDQLIAHSEEAGDRV